MARKASVALCTFQGAGFLQEQLDSLEHQSRQPDELVVCDDGSTDQTPELLRRFAARAPFPMEVNVSPRRLGPAKAFERAISLCRGEILFLCDQDDVWSPSKIERTLRAFEDSPTVGAVTSDAALLHPDGRHVGDRLWAAIGVDGDWRRRFARGDSGTRVRLLAQRNAVSGATLAFRSDFRDLVLPIPEGWGHDEWIGLLLAAAGELRMLPEPLVGYRVHPGQWIGLGRHRTWGARWRSRSRSSSDRAGRRADLLARADLLDAARDRLVAEADRQRIQPALDVLAEHAGHLRARAGTGSRGQRVGSILTELLAGRYHRHSRGWTSAVRDLLESG